MRTFLKYFLFILLISINFDLASQNKTDSLKIIFEKLNKNKISDKTTITILRQLYDEYKISAPDSAIKYANTALEISVEINDTLETAYINRLIGDVYLNQKIYYLAMKSYYDALKIFDKLNIEEEYAFSLMDIAYTHYIENINYEYAINYYLESITIFEKIQNLAGLAKAYNLIALVYSNQNFYKDALNYLSKSLTICQKYSLKQLESQSYFDIAIIYKNQQNYNEAIGYLENALIICNENYFQTSEIFFEKGKIYKLLGRFEEAEINFNLALEKYEMNGDKIKIADTYNALAELYFETEDYSSSIDYAQKTLKISNENNFLEPKQNAYYTLSNVYAKIGEIELAFRSFNYYSQIKDSIFAMKSADRYTDLQVSIKTLISDKEKQILKSEKELQEYKNKKQLNLIYLYSGLLLLLFILLILLYSSFRLKRKNAEKLKQLADVSIEGIAFHDNGILLEVNETYTKMLGYKREELIGKSIFDFVDENEHEKLRQNIKLQENSFYQITHICKDGNKIITEVSTRPIIFKKKQVKVASIKDITEQLSASKKLLETEMKFSTLVETSPDSVVIIDKSGKIDYVSKTFRKLFEIADNYDINKNPVTDFINEEYIQKIRTDINNILDEKYDGVSEYKATKFDKSVFFIECNGEVLKDSDNNVIGAFLIIRDITERKLTENALIESETRFRGLFDNASDGIIIHDKNFKIIDVNPFVSDILGYSYDELLHLNILSIITNRKNINFDLEKEIKKNQTTEIQVETKFKKQIYVQIKFSKLTYENQQQYMSIIRDITENKIIEENLRKSEEKFRNLAELSPASVCELDLQGNFIFKNKFSYQMFGYNYDDNVTNVLQTVIYKDHPRVIADMNSIAQGQTLEGKEYTGLKKDGTLFPIMVYTALLKQNDNATGFRSIVVDISARKHYEEELKLIAENLKISNTTKDKMFSIIAHDLRGPIGNLKAMMELLLESPEEFEASEITEIISSLKESSVSTYDLLENLLNWAKSQQGLVEYIPDVYDLNAVIENTISTQILNAKNKKIEIFNEIPPKIKVICDVNMIKTVLRNLISNAVKFTKEGGKISISHKLTDGQIIISVKDSGIGIDASNLTKIFSGKEFFSTYGTNHEKGSGLGLILCKEFVEKNNGKIWAESKPGEGSTFNFSLKLN